MKATKILNKTTPTKAEILNLLKIDEADKNKLIKIVAKNFRQQLPKDYHQNEGTIEISNYCDANCLFCNSRNENGKIERFRLNREEIIEEALALYKLGKQSIIIHSGYDKFYNRDRIAYIIYTIKKRADLKITLSFGLRKFNEYKAWKIAGADSYFLNFVTSNKILYEKTKSWGKFEDRLAHIAKLKRLGYNIGSGSIIGLPNQTLEDIADDILLCKNLNINHINFCQHKFPNSGVSDISVEQLLNRGIDVAQIVLQNRNVGYNALIN
ncbi:MAG: radical SAM protein [Melioribacteraceae bacterium]|nr:radical SAM protein [Melioribacteraceae bacterium]